MKPNIFLAGGIAILLTMLSGCRSASVPSHDQNNLTAAGYNVQLGMGYLKQGNIERAKFKLLKAVNQAPNWPPALDAMGYFYEKTGDVKTARYYYQRALNIDPNNGLVQNNYATFLCRQKRYSDAEKYFLLAATNPTYINTVAAYENAGLCALSMPDTKKAAVYFRKAIAQDPSREVSVMELKKLSLLSPAKADNLLGDKFK